MHELPPLGKDDFDAYFEAIHGYSPFPWQARLAKQLAEGGGWPEMLDLPTASGKTAAIDLAIFHLALEAGNPMRSAPRRIVYVVDRRTIVDQAHQRAGRIASAIDEAQHPVLAAVRARLASLGRDALPLRVALLRGAIARNDMWARCPDQPLVAVSTVDQVGSRLLFRGYGVSDTMRPIHAGLLGNDVLYLLDEVHLSEPFRETLAAIGGRYRKWADSHLRSPFTVVEMSATPGAARETSFRLAADDERHPVLDRRLAAKKLTTLASATGKAFLQELEKHARAMASEPAATVAVVVNRVATARELHARLTATLEGTEVHLLTGRMRPVDRDKLEKQLFPRIRAGRTNDPDQPPVVVVATQCIEAGADFDFDGLVTECASLDALRQRFGRLDRMGRRDSPARAVIVARTDTLEDDPVYGSALGATWRWLERASTGSEEIDLGLRGLALPADAAAAGLLAPRSHAPVLLPSHLDAFVQTSPAPTPDPDVALWLHGPDRGVADVQIVWRADLSPELLLRTRDEDGDTARAAREVAVGLVHAVPPASGEAISVPLPAARRWLDGRAEPDVFDVEGVLEDAPRDDEKDERASWLRLAVAWRGDSSEVVDSTSLRPGDTLVVPASYGGILSGTWTPSAVEAVADVAELAVLTQRGRAMLRLHPEVLRSLFGQIVSPPVPAPLDAEDLDDRAAVTAWLAKVPTEQLRPEVQRLLDVLRREAREGQLRVERLPLGPDSEPEEYFCVSSRRRILADDGDVSTEDDRASFTGVEVPLESHLRGVASVAAEFADRVGLPSEVIADLKLAGRWHDVGKVDVRFQRLLQGGSEYKTLVQPEPLAKSAMPTNDWRARRRAQERSGYPAGARHEVMSVALMASAAADLAPVANDWDLVLHLVASHHGRCRPFPPWIPDPEPIDVAWELDGTAFSCSSGHEMARLDSGVGERFWRLVRRYGWWGLAWLEAILRLGDHRRSEDEQHQGGSPS